jgi:hypothetical protein
MTQMQPDWIAETPESIRARLDGAQEAQRQTRFTLGMMAMVSMMMLILSYNAYLSFDSRWILARVHETLPALDKTTSVAGALTHYALQDWAASRNATVDLLGIRVSVDDAAILGTVSLFIFSLWLMLVARRENHTIGSLLRDTDTPGADDDTRPVVHSNGQRWLIFHSIAANNLFVTFDSSLPRVQVLRRPGGREAVGSNSKNRICTHAFSFARDFFFWFPVTASAFVFALDRRSYFQPDPFAPAAAVPGANAPLFYESMAVFIACWLPLLLCCYSASRYSRSTETVLREYGRKLRSDLLFGDRAKRVSDAPALPAPRHRFETAIRTTGAST